MSLFSRGTSIFSSINKGPKHRPPFEGIYLYILGILIGYWMSDLGVLFVRPSLLPTQPPPMRPSRPVKSTHIDIARYYPVTSRNIFNEDGKIAPKLTADGTEMQMADADPVLSQLPLKLEGTLVHSNPKKSVATVMLKTKNETRAAVVDQDLDGLARVVRVERRKLVFRNLNNNRLEYIDIPKDTAVTFGVKDPVVASGGEEVQKKGEFDFTMRRADIAKYTADLGSILQQARMVPNIVPGSGGRVDGFRFVAIQPNSIYEKLGFKPMDVIKKVNGEDINSPTKAMELYNALKSEGRISLTVERNGREEAFKYDIQE
jgi:general secretion pathway protein C